MDNRKHVYILGAGFSVPLGGPLFTHLLTGTLYSYCDGLWQEAEIRNAISELHVRGGFRRLDQTLDRQYTAEELLELVDWAARNTNSHQAFALLECTSPERYRQGPCNQRDFFELLNKQLKRAIACQCSAFLLHLEDTSERWRPYLKWFERLTSDDTIITFNYDTAVERIASRANSPFPSEPGRFQPGKPKLIKLHGSADWYWNGREVVQAEDAYQNDVDVAIGMPGNAKANITDDALFKSLWDDARRTIEDAEFVSIVGYSMPETDNNARMMILDSIAQGRERKSRIDLVLGPDMGTVRAKRMISILQPLIGRKARVVDVSMFTQDYIERVPDYRTFDF